MQSPQHAITHLSPATPCSSCASSTRADAAIFCVSPLASPVRRATSRSMISVDSTMRERTLGSWVSPHRQLTCQIRAIGDHGNRRDARARACMQSLSMHSLSMQSLCMQSLSMQSLTSGRDAGAHARDPMPRDGVWGSRRGNQHAISMQSVCNQCAISVRSACNQCAISVRSAHRVMQCRARRRGTSDRDENGQPAALHDGRPVGLLITSEHLMRGPIMRN